MLKERSSQKKKRLRKQPTLKEKQFFWERTTTEGKGGRLTASTREARATATDGAGVNHRVKVAAKSGAGRPPEGSEGKPPPKEEGGGEPPLNEEGERPSHGTQRKQRKAAPPKAGGDRSEREKAPQPKRRRGMRIPPLLFGAAAFLLLLWVVLFSSASCWVVLLGFLILWMVLRFSSPFASPPLGSGAFSPAPFGLALIFLRTSTAQKRRKAARTDPTEAENPEAKLGYIHF